MVLGEVGDFILGSALETWRKQTTLAVRHCGQTGPLAGAAAAAQPDHLRGSRYPDSRAIPHPHGRRDNRAPSRRYRQPGPTHASSHPRH